MSTRGFGYRWGPQRGERLYVTAPLSWRRGANPATGRSAWSSRPGAELLPNGDSHGWIEVSPRPGLRLHRAPTASTQGLSGTVAPSEATPTPCADLLTRVTCGHQQGLLYAQPATWRSDADDQDGSLPHGTPTMPTCSRRSFSFEGDPAGRPSGGQAHGLVACELENTLEAAGWSRGCQASCVFEDSTGFAEWDLVDGRPGRYHLAPHYLRGRSARESTRSAPCLYLDQTPAVSMVYLNGCLVGRGRYPQERQRRLVARWLAAASRQQYDYAAQWTRGADPGIGVARLGVGPCVGVADRKVEGRSGGTV